jgi:hypothetical protein
MGKTARQKNAKAVGHGAKKTANATINKSSPSKDASVCGGALSPELCFID